MKMGQVVFLFAQRSLQIGRVIGQQPGRLEVETPQGDRRVIPERRLAHRSARTVPTIAALVAYEQELCDLQKQIDLGTVWSILESEPPSSRYTVESLSNIAWSTSESGLHTKTSPCSVPRFPVRCPRQSLPQPRVSGTNP